MTHISPAISRAPSLLLICIYTHLPLTWGGRDGWWYPETYSCEFCGFLGPPKNGSMNGYHFFSFYRYLRESQTQLSKIHFQPILRPGKNYVSGGQKTVLVVVASRPISWANLNRGRIDHCDVLFTWNYLFQRKKKFLLLFTAAAGHVVYMERSTYSYLHRLWV